jgi:hypothetical protein
MPRGDGRVSVRAAAAQLGIARSVVGDWCRRGFRDAAQKAALAPRWIRLTPENLARLDGTLAAHGHGRWRFRETPRQLGRSEADRYQRVREGQPVAYRARVGEHWQSRLSPKDNQPLGGPPTPASIQAPT